MAIVNPIGDAAAAQFGAGITQATQNDEQGQDRNTVAAGNTRGEGVDLSLSEGAEVSLAETQNTAVTANQRGSGAETSNNRDTAANAQTAPAQADSDVAVAGERSADVEGLNEDREDRDGVDSGVGSTTTNADGTGDGSVFDGVQLDLNA